MTRKNCSCGAAAQAEFDAETAHRNLAHKVQELANIMIAYMAEANLERPERATRAKSKALDAERIVGGVPTSKFPECCLVGHRNSLGDFEWFCTGVLIHPRVVLTAGHCNVTPPGEQAPTINVVALGVSSQDALEVQGAEILPVWRRRTHPGYVETGEVNDITVLLLGADAQTAPMRVATTAETSAAQDVALVGFGNSDINSSVGFGLKRTVSVPIDSIRRADGDDLRADEQKYGFDSSLELVAGGGGKDSCNGDSGGPAYIVVGDGSLRVAGLTSRAAGHPVHPCGDAGVYTRIDSNWDFVTKIARKFGIDLAQQGPQ